MKKLFSKLISHISSLFKNGGASDQISRMSKDHLEVFIPGKVRETR